jgi:hypothetical protein
MSLLGLAYSLPENVVNRQDGRLDDDNLALVLMYICVFIISIIVVPMAIRCSPVNLSRMIENQEEGVLLDRMTMEAAARCKLQLVYLGTWGDLLVPAS